MIGWVPGERPGYWTAPSDTAGRWRALTTGAFAPWDGGRWLRRRLE